MTTTILYWRGTCIGLLLALSIECGRLAAADLEADGALARTEISLPVVAGAPPRATDANRIAVGLSHDIVNGREVSWVYLLNAPPDQKLDGANLSKVEPLLRKALENAQAKKRNLRRSDITVEIYTDSDAPADALFQLLQACAREKARGAAIVVKLKPAAGQAEERFGEFAIDFQREYYRPERELSLPVPRDAKVLEDGTIEEEPFVEPAPKYKHIEGLKYVEFPDVDLIPPMSLKIRSDAEGRAAHIILNDRSFKKDEAALSQFLRSFFGLDEPTPQIFDDEILVEVYADANLRCDAMFGAMSACSGTADRDKWQAYPIAFAPLVIHNESEK